MFKVISYRLNKRNIWGGLDADDNFKARRILIETRSGNDNSGGGQGKEKKRVNGLLAGWRFGREWLLEG